MDDAPSRRADAAKAHAQHHPSPPKRQVPCPTFFLSSLFEMLDRTGMEGRRGTKMPQYAEGVIDGGVCGKTAARSFRGTQRWGNVETTRPPNRLIPPCCYIPS